MIEKKTKPYTHPGRRPKAEREMGVNNIEIICKLADECRQVHELREYVVEQLDIYKTLLKIIDGEFNYDQVYENSSDADKFDIILRAARRLG